MSPKLPIENGSTKCSSGIHVVHDNVDDEEGDNDSCGMDSADEALCELLGLTSLNVIRPDHHDDMPLHNNDDHHDDDDDKSCTSSITDGSEKEEEGTSLALSSSKWDTIMTRMIPFSLPRSAISTTIQKHNLHDEYQSESVCVLPAELAIPSHIMRRLTDELIWGTERYRGVDRTYETIRVMRRQSCSHGVGGKQQQQQQQQQSQAATTTTTTTTAIMEERKRVLTRLENFVNYHEGWNTLCHGYIQHIISSICQTEMALYKEKLNIKPPNGSGFAPHLDTPSLRVALDHYNHDHHHHDAATTNGPQTFVTVMIAIDNMTIQNGCLRLVRGSWSERHHCPIRTPPKDGNPDGDGRAGAIPTEVAERQMYQDLPLGGGHIAVFNGWTPHRSGVNASHFARRAVFLTYNPLDEGDFHYLYYKRMKELRDGWRRNKNRDGTRSEMMAGEVFSGGDDDERRELDALATIPRI